MEGHGGLRSAADVQGKSPPLPPALPPKPVGRDLWLVPKPGGCPRPTPPSTILVLGQTQGKQPHGDSIYLENEAVSR